MESKQLAQLEQAKAFFYAWRMQDCYNILRRYFDRLPFQPEEGHAEYIGIFCRVLGELGKTFELGFYIKELEKIYERTKDPALGYALASAYCHTDEPRHETSKKLLEQVCKSTTNKKILARSKMFMARLYALKEDYVGAGAIIDSIEKSGDEGTDRLVEIWRANVLRTTGRNQEALDILRSVLSKVSFETDWYAFFSAKLIEVLTLSALDREEEVNEGLATMRAFLKDKAFKTTREQFQQLEKDVSAKNKLGTIRFEEGAFKSAFIYGKKKIYICQDNPAEKLLILLLKKSFITKTQIVRQLYSRTYTPDDDKLVYYHIHNLRRKLKEFGLPSEALNTEPEGYRLVPEVELVRENE